MKIIITDSTYNMNKMLKEYKIIYSNINNYKEVDNCDINVIQINNLNELNYIDIEPIIVNISHVDKKEEYKQLIKYLKKLKNKVLIINDNDKYLKKIFLNKLDIYRYGNNVYDDIEYKKEKNNIIIKYEKEKYKINKLNESIIGYIIIGLLFGLNIKEILINIEEIN